MRAIENILHVVFGAVGLFVILVFMGIYLKDPTTPNFHSTKTSQVASSNYLSPGPTAPNPQDDITPQNLQENCPSDEGRLFSCEDTVIRNLNHARVVMGLKPYKLPRGFASLPSTHQIFILANEDRKAYGIPALKGISPELNGPVTLGAIHDEDPEAPVSLPAGNLIYSWGATQADHYENALSAYYDWMYNDGLGSPNLNCKSVDASGCWGHRQAILLPGVGIPTMAFALRGATDGQGSYALLIAYTRRAPTYYSPTM
jgi:hypothetical protein